LVERLPALPQEPDHNVEVVTVYRSIDPAMTMLARSLLDSAGIPYYLIRENLQDLLAGRYLVSGPTEFQVETKDAPAATAVLAELDAGSDALPDDEPEPSVGKCDIRAEEAGDEEGVREVLRSSFRRDAEVTLVDQLRAHDKAAISLVAICDGEVVGHVMFSPITVQYAFAGFRGLGLGPIGVRQEYQNNGIGAMLVQRGIETCRNRSIDVVFVLGNPHFWGRFGFTEARQYGLSSEYNADSSFLVLELQPQSLKRLRGVVRYSEEFAACGC
jgi:putative acetyltransferase